MPNTIPIHQAIKFYDNPDDVFNETDFESCPCNLNEKWEYIIKPGDVTMVQVKSDCIPVTFGANIISNGSFEIEGTGPTDPQDWTINDSEKVERANDDPFQGQWELRWNNPNGLGTATQDTDTNFLAGEVWLLEFYTKVTNPATAYLTPLQVTVGALDYLVTPTEEYTLISIPIFFQSNGADQNIIFEHNSASPAADFMYVDLVILRKVNYTQNNCEFNLVYNGDFEYGQAKVTGESPVAANFDGWTIGGTVEASITGGLDGTRCSVLEGAISTASLTQVYTVMAIDGFYLIKFWAKAANDGDILTFSIDNSAFTQNIELTTEWEEYSFTFPCDDVDQLLVFSVDVDDIYIDNVSVTLINTVNEDSIYVHDVDNDKYYTDNMGVTDFEGGYNAEFFWEDIIGSDIPGCLQIIAEFAESNLITNGKFEEGTGDLFTGWTLTPGNGTIVQVATGGLSGSRGLQFNRVTNLQSIAQLGILDINTEYTISFWGKIVSGTPSLQFSSISSTFGNVPITSSSFKRYSFTFTTGATDTAISLDSLGNNSSFIIDNVFISQGGDGVYYSELFTYDKTGGVCAPLITWYDRENCFGINYESEFKNYVRLKDINFQAISYPTEMTKTLNGLESSISFAEIRKQKTLNITPSPELIHDRLAVAIRHSNFEVDTEALCSTDETVYTYVDNESGGRLQPATVILGIEGEILAERSINCE